MQIDNLLGILQNLPLITICEVAAIFLLVFWLIIGQYRFRVQLRENIKQQVFTNDQLNRVITELRKIAHILSTVNNAEAFDQEAKLYVGNIDYGVSERELESLFVKYGQVVSVNIPVDRYSGKKRGFGFVTLKNTKDALRALDLNGTEFKGRQLQINFAKDR